MVSKMRGPGTEGVPLGSLVWIIRRNLGRSSQDSDPTYSENMKLLGNASLFGKPPPSLQQTVTPSTVPFFEATPGTVQGVL